ncbi:MAG: hypothetical protein V3V09_04655 [Arenicellales bacterium]
MSSSTHSLAGKGFVWFKKYKLTNTDCIWTYYPRVFHAYLD